MIYFLFSILTTGPQYKLSIHQPHHKHLPCFQALSTAPIVSSPLPISFANLGLALNFHNSYTALLILRGESDSLSHINLSRPAFKLTDPWVVGRIIPAKGGCQVEKE